MAESTEKNQFEFKFKHKLDIGIVSLNIKKIYSAYFVHWKLAYCNKIGIN